MQQRQAMTQQWAAKYQRAKKKERGKILDHFTESTQYHRSYAAWVLRTHGKRVRLDRRTVVVGDVRKKARRARAKRYDDRVIKAVRLVWAILGGVCSKLLVAALPEMITKLEQAGELRLDTETRLKVLAISAATIDRRLGPIRRRMAVRRRGGTKPGSVLKHQIPIRTFSQWDEGKPGFVEADLVGHDGGQSSGDYAQTLDMTDVYSGWTETQAVQNKAQVWVFEAIKEIRARLPFPLLGIDSDNGSEFINAHLYRYCEQEHITFTRGRPYRKNDGCYVEQKNYTVVRRSAGYRRYDTIEQVTALNELYSHLRLLTNFFVPVMKLKSKERIGSKVKKKYDQPRTPCERLLGSADVSGKDKRRLRAQYEQLNPMALKRQAEKVEDQLDKMPSKQIRDSKRQWEEWARKGPREEVPFR